MQKETFNRVRNLALTAAFAGAGIWGLNAIPRAEADGTVPNPTATPTPTPTPELTASPSPTPGASFEVPSARDIFEACRVEGTNIEWTGVADEVDLSTVDMANHEPFESTLGRGFNAFFAEPGGLLVGPDFGSRSNENPWGRNPEGWNTMYESGGSIRPFSSVSQEVLRMGCPAFQNLPEGGFVLASAGEMTVEIGDARFVMPHMENNNYFFVVRGAYGDNAQNTDLNKTMFFTDFVPGHTLVNMYEARDETNTAFISEGQFLQMVDTAQNGGTNCGDGGCSIQTVVGYDVNTGYTFVARRSGGQDSNPANGWEVLAENVIR